MKQLNTNFSELMNVLRSTMLLLLLLVFTLLFFSANVTAATINIENKSYAEGEIVNFVVVLGADDSSSATLEITSAQDSFLLFDDVNGSHKFMPPKNGNYIIVVKNSNKNEIASADFTVGVNFSTDDTQTNSTTTNSLSATDYIDSTNADSENKNMLIAREESVFAGTETTAVLARADQLTLDKNIYYETETVNLFLGVSPQDYDLSISNDEQKVMFRFLGGYGAKEIFLPRTTGNYTVLLSGKNGQGNLYLKFTVIKKEVTSSLIKIKNARNNQIQSSENFLKFGAISTIMYGMTANEAGVGQVAINSVANKKYDSIPAEQIQEGAIYDTDLNVQGSHVKKIRINNLKYSAGESIGVDEFNGEPNITNKDEAYILNKRALKTYAIDLGGLNFTDAVVSVTASGSELYECKDWNFTTRLCEGIWQKKMQIHPGEEYNLTLTPGDPGYAEFGVASINTNKSIYSPGEVAEINIVVLDNNGYLVQDAQIDLNITTPNNQIVTLTTPSQIIMKEKGIYSTNYTLNLEGYYSLSVHATGNNVDNYMQSYFLVDTTHPFDIIRTAPMTVDPSKGSFKSTINVIFRNNYTNNYTNVDLTEKLPINFSIEDTGGAEITQTDQFSYLLWTNLSDNAEVSYAATPPDIVPYLWELGPSWIEYYDSSQGNNKNIFSEAKPWYLAVDPSVNYDPNRNITIGWARGTGGNGYYQIDDGIRQPTVPTLTDYVRSRTNDATTSRFGFPSVTDSYIDNITLWVYTTTESSASYNFNLSQNGTPRCNRSLGVLTAVGWYNCNWTSVSGDLTNLSLVLGAVTRTGGTNSNATVYAAYLEVKIVPPPNISLNSPYNNSIWNNSLIDFNFTANSSRNINLTNCSLWANFTGSWVLNGTIYNVTNATMKNITRTLTDGRYIWNINCSDGVRSAFAPKNYTLTVDNQTPLIKNQALNQTIINQSKSVRFNLSATDSFGISAAIISLKYPNGTTTNITLQGTGPEYYTIISSTNQSGVYNITNIYANDSLGQFGQNSSPNVSFTVTLSPPAAFSLISPLSGTLSTNLTPTFSWQQTAEETFANYTLLVGKDQTFQTPDFTYYTFEITNTTYNLSVPLDVNSIYFWKVLAYDVFGSNTNSTQVYNYSTDGAYPNVTLISSDEIRHRGVGLVDLNYTPFDMDLKNCTLYIDLNGTFAPNETDNNPSNNNMNNFSEIYLDQGFYNWNVLCYDNSGHFAFAYQNETINVTGPDLTISTGNIYFGNESRVEGVNITVYANITNQGLTDIINPFIVQFYEDNPDTGGTQIGNDVTVSGLLIGQTTTVNTTNYILKAGSNNIFVRLNHNNLTNESDFSNNEANNSVSVSIYNYYFGNVTGKTMLVRGVFSLMSFGNTTDTKGVIFFSNENSEFSFQDLQSVTRDKQGLLVSNAFTEVDSALNTTSYYDSIKQIWGAGTDTPQVTRTFILTTGAIYNVPIANSTNTSDFVTGILWDTADDKGNNQYDSSDDEDIVFVTEINKGKQGEYGTYDMEARIPAALKDYKLGSSAINFYVELQ